MQMSRSMKRIMMPGAILLCAVIGLAQVVKWQRNTLSSASTSTQQYDKEMGERTADDPWAELEQIYHVMKQGSGLSYEGSIVLTDEEATDVLERADFSGNIHGTDYQYMIDSVEFLHKNGLSVNIYHREKLVIAGKENMSSNPVMVFANIDSLKKLAGTEGASAEVFLDKELKVLKMANIGSSDVVGYDIYYHPENYVVAKVVLHLTTLDDLGGDEQESAQGMGESSQLIDTTGEEDATHDTSLSGPVIELNLYRMELTYTHIRSVETTGDFDPIKKYGKVERNGFQINDQYADYRVVWMGESKKKGKN